MKAPGRCPSLLLLCALTGCSALYVEGPGPVSAAAPTCRDTNWPLVDVIAGAGALVASAAAWTVLNTASIDGDDFDDSAGLKALFVTGVSGVPTGLGYATSSIFGYRRAAACDEAWELWRARHGSTTAGLPRPSATAH